MKMQHDEEQNQNARVSLPGLKSTNTSGSREQIANRLECAPLLLIYCRPEIVANEHDLINDD